MTDPCSWLQIQQGWNVVTSDGTSIGAVAQVEGDKQSDIFDGLAVESGDPKQVRYVPGEQVGPIYPGEVTLKIGAAEAASLGPFQAALPETTWHPGKPSFSTRVANLFRGNKRQ
jgi:hypothetical protein